MNTFYQNIPADILISIKGMNFSMSAAQKNKVFFKSKESVDEGSSFNLFKNKSVSHTKECSKSISEIIERSVLKGGKRLRPLLTMLMGKLFNLKNREIVDFARLIEFVHAASLAHDDVIDNAQLRRGNPSINILAGNKKSVLAGDYLLSEVIVLLAEKGNLEILKETSQVIQKLAQGEWIQHEALLTRTYTEDIISQVAILKTGSVMSWCSTIPAILANADQKVISYCREFGERLGIAFQQIDDTLDFSVNSSKDIHLDLQNGVVNSVLFIWMENNSLLREDFKNNTLNIANINSYDGLNKAIDAVKISAEKHLDECQNLLDKILKCHYTKQEDNLAAKEASKSLRFILEFVANRSI